MSNCIIRWDITSRCNMNCQHCYVGDRLNRGKDLSLTEINKILDHLIPIPNKTYILYGGEPLIREDIIDIVDSIKRRQSACMITTNGSYLDKKIKMLERVGLDGIAVSIEAVSEKEYSIIRKQSDYDSVIEAIKVLGNSSIKHKALNCVITENNVMELYQIMKLAKSHNIERVNFDLVAIGGNAKKQKDEMELKIESLFAGLSKLFREISTDPGMLNIANLDVLPPLFLKKLYSDIHLSYNPREVYHYAPYQSFYIDFDGKAYPCRSVCPTFDYRKHIMLIDGQNLLEITGDQLLKSEAFETFFMKGATKNKIQYGFCSNCIYLHKECYPCPLEVEDTDHFIGKSCSGYPIANLCEYVIKELKI